MSGRIGKRQSNLNKSIEQFGSGYKSVDSICKNAGIRYSYEMQERGFKFILYRTQFQSDIPNASLDVNATLNGTDSKERFKT